MHAEASRFLAMRCPTARVLTAWPAADELSRPWLGYVSRGFPVVRIENFSAAQIDLAVAARDRFDVALVFSTKYEPEHPLMENWDAWRRVKERFFGYHRDLSPEDVAQRLGGTAADHTRLSLALWTMAHGTIVYHKEVNGQWIAVIALEREQNVGQIPASTRSHSQQMAGVGFDHDPNILAGTQLQVIARR